MGLKFYLGPSGSGKSTKLYDDIIQEAKLNPQLQYLLIVPEQFTMQTQKEMVMRHPNKGILNIDVLSFGRLAHRILEQKNTGKTPILDDTGKNLILRKIAGECMQDLPVIGRHLRRSGYISEVKSAISEFMQYSISPEELAEMIATIQGRPRLVAKLTDLQYMYHQFCAYLEGHYVTTEETMDLLAKQIPNSEWLAGSVIALDGFTGFTPVQNKVLEELMKHSKDVWITALVDGRGDPYEQVEMQNLYYLPSKMATTLSGLTRKYQIERKQDVLLLNRPVYRHANGSVLAFLEANLFRTASNRQSEIYGEDPSAQLEILEAPHLREEVMEICHQIQELVRVQGYCYRDFAVVTGDLSSYAPYYEEYCIKWEIPYYIDQSRPLLRNPFVAYLRAAIMIIQKNYSYEAVFQYLRSGMSPLGKEEVDALDNYVIALGIRGKKAWHRKFVRPMKQVEEPEALLEFVNSCRQKFVDSLKMLPDSPDSAEQAMEILYAFVKDNHCYDRLAERAKNYHESGDFGKAKEYDQVYSMVMKLFEQVHALLGKSETTWEELAEILDAGYEELEIGMIPQNVDRVVLGDIERTRLKDVKVLFFAGVNDGVIPRSNGAGGILSDIDREYLAGCQWDLSPTPREKMYIQKLYLYMMMTKPSKRLYLSYAKTGVDGSSVRPSYLIDQILRMFPALRIQSCKSHEDVAKMIHPSQALSKYTKLLAEYVEEGDLSSRQWNEFAEIAACLEQIPEYQSILQKLEVSAFGREAIQSLPKEVSRQLYGEILYCSVSRLETYVSCAYRHYLQYGLQLREREEYVFDALDLGNLYHKVLERYPQYLKEVHKNWLDFDEKDAREGIAKAMQEYALGVKESVLYSTSRNYFAISRMERILLRTLLSLQEHLRAGDFVPVEIEKRFENNCDYQGMKMKVTGVIDRIDLCQKEDQLYVKVVDYKSGGKSLQLGQIYYGMQLQLAIYLDEALKYYKKNYPDKQVIPAGMLYYQINDPMIDCLAGELSAEELAKERRKKLKMTGKVNSDPTVLSLFDHNVQGSSEYIPVIYKKDGDVRETPYLLAQDQLELVTNYARNMQLRLGSEIARGDMSIRPLAYDQQMACGYCPYMRSCSFDTKRDQGQCLYRKKVGEADALALMERVVGGEKG